MLLIQSDTKRWAEADEATTGSIDAEYWTYTQALIDAGVMLGGEPLERADTARVVAAGGVVTDGPFAETAEQLGGYYILDVPDEATAIEWAAKLPGVERGLDRIEVRKVMELPPEMAHP
jgi:hypothetical protein